MKWLVTEGIGKSFDVTKGGRAFRYGFPTVEDALDAIKSNRAYSVTDTILIEDADGYRHRPVR